MAGGLTISTLNDSSGVLATQNGMKGIAKAWVAVDTNTTPPNILGAFNVSSLTRSATGEYYVNFTTAMPNSNYAVSAFMSMDNGALMIVNEYNSGTTRDSATTTSVRLIARTTAGAAANRAALSCIILGS